MNYFLSEIVTHKVISQEKLEITQHLKTSFFMDALQTGMGAKISQH